MSKKIIADIEWYTPTPMIGDFELYGKVGTKLLFIIESKGKRKPKYYLKSYPFDTELFTRANNYKRLFDHADLERVKQEATNRYETFVNLFLKK